MTDNEFDYEDIIDDLEGLERLKLSLESQRKNYTAPAYNSGSLVLEDNPVEELYKEENAMLQKRLDRINSNIQRKRQVLSQQRYKLIISGYKEKEWNQNNQNQNQTK